LFLTVCVTWHLSCCLFVVQRTNCVHLYSVCRCVCVCVCVSVCVHCDDTMGNVHKTVQCTVPRQAATNAYLKKKKVNTER
jgi:hypothetical protein